MPSWRHRWCCRPRQGRRRPRTSQRCSWWTVLTLAASDDLTVTTACVTSKYGDEKSTAALRCSVIENSDRLASNVFGPGANAALKGTRTHRTSSPVYFILAATAYATAASYPSPLAGFSP